MSTAILHSGGRMAGVYPHTWHYKWQPAVFAVSALDTDVRTVGQPIPSQFPVLQAPHPHASYIIVLNLQSIHSSPPVSFKIIINHKGFLLASAECFEIHTAAVVATCLFLTVISSLELLSFISGMNFGCH